MKIIFPLLERRPRRRRAAIKVPPYVPPTPFAEVLVVSVVGIAGGDVVVTFSSPVTLTATPLGEAVWFEEEGGGRGGYVSEMEQAAADAIIMRVDGLPLSTGCSWAIVATPENLLPTAGVGGGSIVVPQGGTVE